MQDMLDLIQVDLEGKIVWKFNKTEYIEDKGEIPQWMARQHHDYQREVVQLVIIHLIVNHLLIEEIH